VGKPSQSVDQSPRAVGAHLLSLGENTQEIMRCMAAGHERCSTLAERSSCRRATAAGAGWLGSLALACRVLALGVVVVGPGSLERAALSAARLLLYSATCAAWAALQAAWSGASEDAGGMLTDAGTQARSHGPSGCTPQSEGARRLLSRCRRLAAVMEAQ